MKWKNRSVLLIVLVLTTLAGVAVLLWTPGTNRTNVVAYFDNSNGIFVGDNVVILGVKIGQIDKIEPQPQGAKITFWIDNKYKVPAEAKAVILSPKLITSRAIQLTPAYTGGPALADGAVIPRSARRCPSSSTISDSSWRSSTKACSRRNPEVSAP